MSVISGESKFGLDIGATTGGILVWDVFAPAEGPKPWRAGRKLRGCWRVGDGRRRPERQFAGRRTLHVVGWPVRCRAC
jgi:hypothetical protein